MAGAHQSSEPLLRIVDLHKRYSDFVALKSVNVQVQPHEFFTILGPSGCGKSTLLRMIGGFERPTSGAVEFRGSDLVNEPPERRPFNTVFQSYALFPHMTVRDNIGYGLRIGGVGRSEIKRRVAEALQMVHLEPAADRLPPTLSGGMRQRVALARALVNEPAILLLDEPLGALDLKMRHTLQTELRTIQHRLGTAFVYVTHDQEEAMSLSDRICVMRNGEVAQIGTPRDLYQRPRSRYVADFIGKANMLSGQVVGKRGDLWEVRLAAGGTVVMPYYADGQPRPGDNLIAVVRPEDFEFTSAEIAGDSAFEGRLADEVYLGADVRYSVQLSTGEIIDVRDRSDASSQFTTEQLLIRVRQGCGTLVPADDEALPVASELEDDPEGVLQDLEAR